MFVVLVLPVLIPWLCGCWVGDSLKCHFFDLLMGVQQSKPGWSTREVSPLLAVVVLIVLVGVFAFLYVSLRGSFMSLQNQYSMLQSQYNALESNYSALRSNYTSLQNQYSTLVSQYNSTLIKYSSILNLIGDCKSPPNYELDSGYATGCVLVVPPGYSTTVTITASSSSEPIDVYVLTVFWQYAYWAESNWNPSSFMYHTSGTNIETTLNLNPGYYVLIIQNTSPQSTYVTYSMTTTYTS